MERWKTCKNILCIRPDNLGDVVMSGPAFRALKESFGCNITLLTSSQGAAITRFMPEIEDVISCDLPWVKTDNSADADACHSLIASLKARKFDGAAIFTVYSQNPLPSAMLAYLAEIPLRLSYCRENPYQLLTDWLPDQEPYEKVDHQVIRDLNLVKHVGARPAAGDLKLTCPPKHIVEHFLRERGVPDENFILIHPSVSEDKRRFPTDRWVKTLQALREASHHPFLFTGSAADSQMTAALIRRAKISHCYNLSGATDLLVFTALIAEARLLLSVNTSAIHIAAAMKTPVVVLYAATNPQHTPWRVPNHVFYFEVPEAARSRNEVVKFGMEHYFEKNLGLPEPSDIAAACSRLMNHQSIALPADANGL